MDLAVLNNLPEPLRSILIGAAGDFLGGMASEITGRLLDAAGCQVKKRFRPEPQQLALNWAMAEALFVTVRSLTDDPELMAHYLQILGEWLARDAVVGELSQIVDPRPQAEIDLDLLAEEFRALGYEPDLLGAGVDFAEVVKRFAGAFYNAAAKEQELQGQLQIGLLRGIALHSEREVELLEEIVAALECEGERQPGSDAGSIHHKAPSVLPISPEFEITAGQLNAEMICPNTQPWEGWEGEPELHWELLLELYVVPPGEAPMTIPFHQCQCSAEFEASDLQASLYDLVIVPPGKIGWIPRRTRLHSHALVTSNLGVEATTTEAKIISPGVIYLRAEGRTDCRCLYRKERADTHRNRHRHCP